MRHCQIDLITLEATLCSKHLRNYSKQISQLLDFLIILYQKLYSIKQGKRTFQAQTYVNSRILCLRSKVIKKKICKFLTVLIKLSIVDTIHGSNFHLKKRFGV
jgi:hypothetical protein